MFLWNGYNRITWKINKQKEQILLLESISIGICDSWVQPLCPAEAEPLLVESTGGAEIHVSFGSHFSDSLETDLSCLLQQWLHLVETVTRQINVL